MFQIANIIDRIRLSFNKEKESYFALYQILGFYPGNIEIYKEALLHKSSAVRSAKGRMLNNERLEFLGDAILDAIVADIVYKHFEGKREGFLTNTRSKIVQRETLNKLAVDIGLDKLIKYSAHPSNHNSYMCGNAFEALIGAVYLDKGYNVCMQFIEERILHRLINIDKVAYKEVNFKSKLIEWSQKNKVKLEFRVVEQTQDVSSPVFQSEVLLENIAGGTGTGYSKKESQQAAAKQALSRLKKEAAFIDAVFEAKRERLEAEHHTQEEPVDENAGPLTETETTETAEATTAEAQPIAEEAPAEEICVEESTIETEITEEETYVDPIEEIIAKAEEEAFRQENNKEKEPA